MSTIISILGAIFALSTIIVIHEFGHYWVAKRCGVFVEKFSIGFGHALYSKTTKQGMLFKIGWVPLGGYVKLRGDDPGKRNPSASDHYLNKPVYQRMLIVLAGPAINFLLAILIYWGIFTAGIPTIKPIIGTIEPNTIASQSQLKPNDEIIAINGKKTPNWSKVMLTMITHYKDNKPLQLTVSQIQSNTTRNIQLPLRDWKLTSRDQNMLSEIGITPAQPIITNRIELVTPHSPASIAGLQAGDKIIAIGQHSITSWQDLKTHLDKTTNGPITLTYQRADIKHTVSINPDYQVVKGETIPRLGIQAHAYWPQSYKSTLRYPLFPALAKSASETGMIINLNLIVLHKLITGQLSIQVLGGPVMIFSTAGTAANSGILSYLLFIAYISIAIGFMNLIPIPGLDGGHFLMQLIELISRKRIPPEWQMRFTAIGFSALILLVIVVSYNDITYYLS